MKHALLESPHTLCKSHSKDSSREEPVGRGTAHPPSQGKHTLGRGKKAHSLTGSYSDENKSRLWWEATGPLPKPSSLWIPGKVQLEMKKKQKHRESTISGLPDMGLEKKSQEIALYLRQGLCIVTSSSHLPMGEDKSKKGGHLCDTDDGWALQAGNVVGTLKRHASRLSTDQGSPPTAPCSRHGRLWGTAIMRATRNHKHNSPSGETD